MQAKVDGSRFGSWALVTGASSGIGREFARQIGASHINVVLVARRQALLDALGTELSRDFGVKHPSSLPISRTRRLRFATLLSRRVVGQGVEVRIRSWTREVVHEIRGHELDDSA